MPSNLLAHHLKFIESVDSAHPQPVEGEPAAHLSAPRPDVLDSLAVTGIRRAERVVFVCTGASARSQLAAALWRRASSIPAAAAGTHPADRIDPGAVDTAHRHALPLRRVRPQHLDEVRDDRDFVITVCDHAHEELGSLPDLHWSVPDPVPVGTPAAFDAALDELTHRVNGLAPRLAAS